MDQRELSVEMLRAAIEVAHKHGIADVGEIACAAMTVAVSMQVALYDEDTSIKLYLGMLAALGKRKESDDV